MPINPLPASTSQLLTLSSQLCSFEAAVLSALPSTTFARITIYPEALRFSLVLPPLRWQTLHRVLTPLIGVASVRVWCEANCYFFRNGQLLETTRRNTQTRNTKVQIWELFNNIPVRRRIVSKKDHQDVLFQCRSALIQHALINPKMRCVLVSKNDIVLLDTLGADVYSITTAWQLSGMQWKHVNKNFEQCQVRGIVSSTAVSNAQMTVIGRNGTAVQKQIVRKVVRLWRQITGHSAPSNPVMVLNVTSATEHGQDVEQKLLSALSTAFGRPTDKAVAALGKRKRSLDKPLSNSRRFADAALPVSKSNPLIKRARLCVKSARRVSEGAFYKNVKNWTNPCIDACTIPCMKRPFLPTTPFTLTKECLKKARIIGQVDRKFIIIGDQRGIYAVDQHAASERYLFERFLRDLRKGVRGKPLKERLKVRLSGPQRHVVQRYEEKLGAFGWKLDGEFVVEAPFLDVLQTWLTDEVDLKLMVDSIANGGSWNNLPAPFVKHAASVACHKAVRFGDVLDREMCENVVRSVADCENGFTCAHGRPAVAPIVVYDVVGR